MATAATCIFAMNRWVRAPAGNGNVLPNQTWQPFFRPGKQSPQKEISNEEKKHLEFWAPCSRLIRFRLCGLFRRFLSEPGIAIKSGHRSNLSEPFCLVLFPSFFTSILWWYDKCSTGLTMKEFSRAHTCYKDVASERQHCQGMSQHICWQDSFLTDHGGGVVHIQPTVSGCGPHPWRCWWSSESMQGSNRQRSMPTNSTGLDAQTSGEVASCFSLSRSWFGCGSGWDWDLPQFMVLFQHHLFIPKHAEHALIFRGNDSAYSTNPGASFPNLFLPYLGEGLGWDRSRFCNFQECLQDQSSEGRWDRDKTCASHLYLCKKGQFLAFSKRT